MEDDICMMIPLPYMKGVSENIEQTIGPTKLKVVFKPLKTMRQTLMKVKNPVPAEKKKGVVYEIPCWDFSQVYVGETGQTLKAYRNYSNRTVEN